MKGDKFDGIKHKNYEIFILVRKHIMEGSRPTFLKRSDQSVALKEGIQMLRDVHIKLICCVQKKNFFSACKKCIAHK